MSCWYLCILLGTATLDPRCKRAAVHRGLDSISEPDAANDQTAQQHLSTSQVNLALIHERRFFPMIYDTGNTNP